MALLFQPAEEDGGGGQVMVQEGVMDRFGISRVFGIHNAPNVPFGHFQTTPGPLMASVDTAYVKVTGRGGHGATPHETVDPVVALVAMVQAVQTIIPRNVYALDEAVISVTMIHAGTASNIIPEEGMFGATIRCFKPDVRALLKKRFHEIVEGTAAAFGVRAVVDYDWGYRRRSTTRTRRPSRWSCARDRGYRCGGRQCRARDGVRGLQLHAGGAAGGLSVPGHRTGAGLHHAAYDFNDEAAPVGASFFARLVERALPLA